MSVNKQQLLTKVDLVLEIREKTNLKNEDSANALDAIFDVIEKAIRHGGYVVVDHLFMTQVDQKLSRKIRAKFMTRPTLH